MCVGQYAKNWRCKDNEALVQPLYPYLSAIHAFIIIKLNRL